MPHLVSSESDSEVNAAHPRADRRARALPSSSSDVAAVLRAKAPRREGLVSPTAHGPSTVEDVQHIFLWPRDAIRAAAAELSDPHDPASFLNRSVSMATQFSGLGSAELSVDMLRSWSQAYRGKPLNVSHSYACEKAPSLHAVLKERSRGTCIFTDITHRLSGLPKSFLKAKTIDFEAAKAAVMQCPVEDWADCVAHGQPCRVPRSSLWVAGPSCKPWSRARTTGRTPQMSHKDVLLFLVWCRIMLTDLPDLVVFENVIGFDVTLLNDLLGRDYRLEVCEMRPEDLGFSFILRPRLYVILARSSCHKRSLAKSEAGSAPIPLLHGLPLRQL